MFIITLTFFTHICFKFINYHQIMSTSWWDTNESHFYQMFRTISSKWKSAYFFFRIENIRKSKAISECFWELKQAINWNRKWNNYCVILPLLGEISSIIFSSFFDAMANSKSNKGEENYMKTIVGAKIYLYLSIITVCRRN